jgi:hypothetical protein
MFSSIQARQIESTSAMFKILALSLSLFFSASWLSCGGKSSMATEPPLPNIAGAWEFITISNNNGYITGMEVAVKEGQVLVDGVAQPNGQFSANSTQIAFVNLSTVSQDYNATGFGGPCGASNTGANSLGPATITALGSQLSFSFSENGTIFNVTGTFSGDGQSFQGSYSQAGTSCPDTGGTIIGQTVSKLSGMFGGQICQPSSTSCSAFPDTVTATLSENSIGSLTVTLAFTAGPDAGTNFTLQGPATGNAFTIQGTFQGQLLTYYGYYEQVAKTGASVYLVNATANTADPTYVGTLPLLQTP